jgi:hypothetical protein
MVQISGKAAWGVDFGEAWRDYRGIKVVTEKKDPDN